MSEEIELMKYNIELNEVMEDGVDVVYVCYSVNGVQLPGEYASVGRSAGSYGGFNGENYHNAHRVALSWLADVAGGNPEYPSPGYCAQHNGRDYLAQDEFHNMNMKDMRLRLIVELAPEA